MPDSTEDLIAHLERLAGDYAIVQRGEADSSLTYEWDQGNVRSWWAARALEAPQAETLAAYAVIAEALAAAERSLGKSVWRTLDTVIIALRRDPTAALDSLKAEAWDEGWDTGFSSASHVERESASAAEPFDKSVNPYRTTPTEGATT
jgi:hypothetical protein